ncbi:MAG TPA: MBL fold metallo-hydrolase [Actinomycetota bacterium]|nr:MBL fold metallo-hydrolase [Actinomycetota bacterium]
MAPSRRLRFRRLGIVGLGWKGFVIEIAPNIHRIGDNSIINSYLLEEAGEVTIIDAGMPGYYKDITRELDTMGRTIADVRALVLTHGHTDHIGFAERLRRERRIPVSIHEADAALARGEVPNPAKGYGPLKLGPFLGFLWFTLLRGGFRTPKLHEVASFGDGATLDVPGNPRVVLAPGHTPGSVALHVPSLKVLFIGDAFATYAVTTGTRGPQVAPFTADAAQAVASLTRLEGISADLILPGHGDPWTDGIQEAVRQIRQREATDGYPAAGGAP